MKMNRKNHPRISSLAAGSKSLFAVAALALGLVSCGQSAKTDLTPYVRSEKSKIQSVNSAVRTELSLINESVPSQGYQVWLDKSFWMGKKIWVSLGVERSSLTGLAMSVDGYHPAYLEREGGFLVLKKDNSGLYGGTVLGPELALNAYPIISESPTEILVDLSKPKTQFGLTLTNFNAGSYADTELAPRLEYLRKVEAKGNRLSFFTVSMTKSPAPLFNPQGNSAEALAGLDPFLLSMTLRNDWIVPEANTDFDSIAATQDTLGFFLTTPKVIMNGLGVEQLVQKIATNQAFTWEVSGNTPEEYRTAVKEGILAWNPSLNTETDVLKVNFAEGFKDSVTDPTVSNMLWDDNMAVGFAFANWRSNPSTGEIVQAQVYMSGSMWADGAKITYQLRKLEEQVRASASAAGAAAPNSPERAEAIAALRTIKSKISAMTKEAKALQAKTSEQRVGFVGLNSGLSKAKARSNAYCFRTVELGANLGFLATIDDELDDALKDLDGETEAERQPDVIASEHKTPTHLPYIAEGVTEEMFAAGVVRGVLMHEIGHTIGLRHNFMGSLGTSKDGAVNSASIMDYNDLVIDTEFTEPGTWDKYVAEAVYLDKPYPEPFSFCSDETAWAGLPTCAPFDFSADPMKGQHVTEESNLLLAEVMLWFGQADMAMNLIMRALSSNLDKVEYVLFPADLATQALNDPAFAESQLKTWKFLTESMNMQGTSWPEYLKVAYRDILIDVLVSGTSDLTSASAVAPELTAFYREVLMSSDAYVFATRMNTLNGLVKIQTAAGRAALVEAKGSLTEKLATTDRSTLTPEATEALVADEELLLRIKKILEVDGYYKSLALN